jgi:hypothetical protein
MNRPHCAAPPPEKRRPVLPTPANPRRDTASTLPLKAPKGKAHAVDVRGAYRRRAVKPITQALRYVAQEGGGR